MADSMKQGGNSTHRTKMVAGNWKMHLTQDAAKDLAKAVVKSAGDNGAEIVLCPSFTLLGVVRGVVEKSRIHLGAQNLYWESKGAFTGEISPEMVVDAGCSHVIIGHSERRQYFGETDATVQRKTQAALKVGLIPIVCVGETLDEREEERTDAVIERQIHGAFERFKPEEMEKVIIAYEPVWAIGTGRTATPEMAQKVHKLIRDWLRGRFGREIADSLRILYGGSIKADNAASLFAEEDIDGGLVGGASLDVEAFATIIEAAR